jgi:brefeldin A-inhibited guanine nucleotide-exchange protein
MTCVFRILFRLFHDRKHANAHELLQRRLLKFVSNIDLAEQETIVSFRLMRDSLEYYLTLQSESHRDAWTNLLMLLLAKLLRLNDERVRLEGFEHVNNLFSL